MNGRRELIRAKELSQKGKNKKAVHFLLEAADLGNPEAMFALGTWYHYGKGVKKNLKKSFHYSLFAAKHGYRLAYYNVALSYEKGEGTIKDLKKAFLFYKKGFEKGDKANCGKELGRVYFHGIGVAKNLKKSFYYTREAAKKGDPDSCFYLGFLYQNGFGVKHSQRWAKYWERKGQALKRKQKGRRTRKS